ncbi:nuclear transport factor 2 family protein [Tsukamurella sp. 1534]|uniref:nuclear transport factor 2 family protein n=1 Tax=Tsukamurella sp. 1534 TaxID=1151061 RepID=UPI0002D3414A|nr:nuclear transport factor 2 family protein [Tsukamurella sp. 1534]
MTTETRDAVEAIHRLKYAYLRAVDTKNWPLLTATLADDAIGRYGHDLATGEPIVLSSRDSIIEYLRGSLTDEIITEHRVTHPVIDVDGDTATGSWYLQDRVICAAADFMLIGSAFYTDRYLRTPEGWRIAETGYERTYHATMSTRALAFDVRPGAPVSTGPRPEQDDGRGPRPA